MPTVSPLNRRRAKPEPMSASDPRSRGLSRCHAHPSASRADAASKAPTGALVPPPATSLSGTEGGVVKP
jgi:hypothetical protein